MSRFKGEYTKLKEAGILPEIYSGNWEKDKDLFTKQQIENEELEKITNFNLILEDDEEDEDYGLYDEYYTY